jgi:hypothetical protein
MSKLRLSLLVLPVLLLVAGSLGASQASAVNCVSSTTLWNVCLGSSLELLSEITIDVKKEPTAEGTTPSKLEVEGGPIIVCSEASGTWLALEGETGTGGVLDGKLEFKTNCKVTNSEVKCEVKEPIVTEELTGTYDATLGGEDTTFAPPAGQPFARVTIKSKVGQTCTLASNETPVTGTQLCDVLKGSEQVAIHLIECEPPGSALLYGESNAKFEATFEAECLNASAVATVCDLILQV